MTTASAVPCGRPLLPGETATLVLDTVYCSECPDHLVTRRHATRTFELRRGAVCGGGNPLD